MKNSVGIAAVLASCLLYTAASAGPPASNADLPAPVAAADLAGMSGGEDLHNLTVTNQTMSATNSGNTVTANSLTTGSINVPTGAFSGYNGVGNFVFNTGNNNNLQGNLSVTIMTPQ